MSDDAKVSLGKDPAAGGARGAGSGPGVPPREEPAAKVSLGKGRPTPKRSEAVKRRSRPVSPPPATRKEAARRLRAERAEERRAGTASGDPGRMLKRDQGPVRAAVRDVVDGRRNLPVLMLPVAVLLVLSQLIGNPTVLSLAARLWTVTLLAVAIDLVVLAVVVKRRVSTTFPDAPGRGHVGYALMRSTVLRRFRVPPPRVSPGSILPSRRR